MTVAAAPTTASAKALTAAQVRGHQPIKSRPLLRYGDSGPTVKFVQRALRLGPDGYYGNTTVAALKKFQLSWGIKVSGYHDHATWGRLTWAAKHKVLYGNKGGVKAHDLPRQGAQGGREAQGHAVPLRRHDDQRGFDCSGYTGYVYKTAGKKLPRTSRQQYSRDEAHQPRGRQAG